MHAFAIFASFANFSLVAAAALATIPACAADNDFYVGAALATKGSLDLRTPAGRVAPDSRSLPFKLYGGYNFNDRFALEAGYTSFGKFKYSQGRSVDLDAFHVAAKGAVHISEAWTAFGKVGAVRHNIDVTGDTPPVREQSKVKPLIGVGIAYKMAPDLKLEVELASYGRIRNDSGRLAFRQLQAGLNYAF